MSIPKSNSINTSKKGNIIIVVLFLVVFIFLGMSFLSNKEVFISDTKDKPTSIENSKEIKKDLKIDIVQTEVTHPIIEEIPKPSIGRENVLDIIEEILPILPMQKKESEPVISFEDINQSVRKSLVNILCITKTGGLLNPLSGSGVIIDDSGVILTNAHVAQYFLLSDYLVEDFITCSIRMGSPSKPMYKAKLMYISDRWIRNNYENIIKSDYSETGEHDYAFLLITGTVSDSISVPDKFDFIKITNMDDEIKVSDSVIIAGYPAGFLGGIAIQKNLYISTTIEQISDVFTFKENTLDLISLGGSILAQKGSSGGAVVNSKGELIAVPVTSTDSEQTDERDLRAITVSHIDRSLREEVGEGINEMLSYNSKTTTELFNLNKFEDMKGFLVKALEN